MVGQTKLLLIACSAGETTDLAKNMFTVLKRDYGLTDQVEILHGLRRDKVRNDLPKAHQHPLIGDYFPDQEVQADIGNNQLKDVVRGKHVALIEHLLTPNRRMSVNDHYMTVRGFLDLVGNVDTLKRTLVCPYLSYVRSHSVEKYRKRGFYQFDSLRKTLMDYQRDGLDALVTIDPHSMKAGQIAEELGMDFHAVNPFQSGRAVNPYKLGLSEEKAKDILKHLRPFQERFAEMRKAARQGDGKEHLYIISVDDGTERRAENFTERAFLDFDPARAYAYLAYLEKDRLTYADATTGFKQFSPIREDNLDREGTFIIIDDMYASGGTAANAARLLKHHDAKRVEVWTSHAVTMPAQYGKANDRTAIDYVVCLDTVPHTEDLGVEFIKSSADLLAAELYKAHQKLAASR